MPKFKDVEMTREEARKVIKDHEKKHGRDMSVLLTEADEKRGIGRHDVPTQAELDAEPEWHKKGKKLDDLPDGSEADD